MDATQEDFTALAAKREKTIVRTSMIGIAANILLAAGKAVIGLAAGSIAVILDAVNNLSDALSSVVTIFGAKLGARQPDRKHPLGHGRIEYLSSMLVAAIVLYAGVTALIESFKKILSPQPAEYTTLSLSVIALAIAVKLLLGAYVGKKGRAVNSGALIATGKDALFDALLSASVLASAVIYLLWGISLEAYVGVLISLFILRAGVEMLRETLSDIIGRRSDGELAARIRQIVCAEEAVLGAYDITLFDYGPDKHYGSLHMELPDTMTVDEVDRITRRLQHDVYVQTGVILTGVGVYSFNTSNDEAAQMRNTVQKAVLSHDWALQMHGFYADTERKTLRFDVVVSFDVDKKQALETMLGDVRALYPDYAVQIVPDADMTDL